MLGVKDSRGRSSHRAVPAAATQMMRVGEETGTLDQQLDAAADYYECELDYKLKRLTASFEPAVIVFMGSSSASSPSRWSPRCTACSTR